MFGVSQYTTWHQSFDDDVDQDSDLGVHAIEVCEFKLDDQMGELQLMPAAEAGLKVSPLSIKVFAYWR